MSHLKKIGKLSIVAYILGVGFSSYAKNVSPDSASTQQPAQMMVQQPSSPSSGKSGHSMANVLCGSEQSVMNLQSGWTKASDKIAILEQWTKLKAEDLKVCLHADTEMEPIGLTLMDLSRHTNAELATKAKAFAEQFDPVAYVNAKLELKPQNYQQDIVFFLLRIEPTHSREIFNKAKFQAEDSQDKSYIEKIVFNGLIKTLFPTVLIPTDSDKGDRYYLKITWNAESMEPADCLSKIFKEVLLSEGSAGQKKMMQMKKGTRWIYWYSKDWVIDLSRSVVECGGKVFFVKGP